MPSKLTIEDCVKFASDRGGKCLSTKYIHGRSKLVWQCEHGHVWKAKFIDIRQGAWCHICGGSKKLNIQDCIDLAEKRGGKCLSKRYKNARTKLKWECKRGHIWYNCFDHIKNRKQWCPRCAKNVKLNISEVKNIVSKKGGKLLSKKYLNNAQKLKVLCLKCNKIWYPSLGNIKSGRWCQCCKLFKTQKKIVKILDKLFPDNDKYINYRGFKWLVNKNTGRRQEIDIWIPDLKLAIEYDGRQHFEPVTFGNISYDNAVKAFNKCKFLDKNKDKLISKHKNDIKFFIRFNCYEEIDINYIKSKLINIGIVLGGKNGD